MDPAQYCREVEAYLCRKNDGHLIRIVGPAFEKVDEWATRGIPLKVVFRGIDRYVERCHARGPRRFPVRVEFCESDILVFFDAWRRAVGVTMAGGAGTVEAEGQRRRPPGLAMHLDRTIARLTACRAGSAGSPQVHEALERIVQELDAMRAEARRARGDARARLVARLAELDGQMLEAVRQGSDPPWIEAARREAETELAPFRSRVSSEEFARMLGRAADRELRDRLGLPNLRFE